MQDESLNRPIKRILPHVPPGVVYGAGKAEHTEHCTTVQGDWYVSLSFVALWIPAGGDAIIECN